jgi:hypothetical protein
VQNKNFSGAGAAMSAPAPGRQNLYTGTDNNLQKNHIFNLKINKFIIHEYINCQKYFQKDRLPVRVPI